VVFVDYTPAPEAHYPVQNEQAYTALEWAVTNASEFGADPGRVALIGESASGNMTAALTLMAKQRGGPKLAAQVHFYPVTNADFTTSTYERYADGPWLTREAMRWFWDLYLPDNERRSEITASRSRHQSSSSAACRRPWSSTASTTYSATRARPTHVSSHRPECPSRRSAMAARSTTSCC
jgi:acetyl esterase/lipase